MTTGHPTALEEHPLALVQETRRLLADGQAVRQVIPGGRLDIDRPQPFLCVARHPPGGATIGAARLAQPLGSYLVVSGEARWDAPVRSLIEAVADQLADRFGAVLVVELWAGEPADDATAAPTFRLHTPRLGDEAPTTVEVLRSALGEVKAFGRPVQVDVLGDVPAPPGMTPLLSNDQLRRLGGLLIGVEVPAQFREPSTGVLLPLVFRRLQADLSRALRQAFFEFAEVDTSYRPGDVRALGPSTLTDAAREVDRQLVEVSCGFEFLPAITPVNSDQAWEAFRASACERAPAFHYRPLPVDPDLLKRQLYDIRIEDVTDPALAAVFRAKRQELDRELTMLEGRDTAAFLPASVQLYGGVDDDLLSLAEAVLARVAGDQPDRRRRALATATTFAARARDELDAYRRDHPNLAAKVVLRDDLPGVMVVEGDVLVGEDLRVAAERVEALLQHEVGTHVVTHANGKAQPLQMLAVGLPGYEETQEGLAVLAEYLVGGLTASRMTLLAARVVAVHHLLAGAGFVETFRALRQRRMAARPAYSVAMRVYRSGGLTKDAMYLRGLADVLGHLGTGGALDPLFVGKLPLSAVPVIEELLWRGVLRPPLVRPHWLDHPSTAGRLAAARAGLTVLDVAAEVAA